MIAKVSWSVVPATVQSASEDFLYSTEYPLACSTVSQVTVILSEDGETSLIFGAEREMTDPPTEMSCICTSSRYILCCVFPGVDPSSRVVPMAILLAGVTFSISKE